MRFTKQEDTRLRRLFKAGLSNAQIGKVMGRHKGSIQWRIKALGLRGEKKPPCPYRGRTYADRTPADIEFLRSLR